MFRWETERRSCAQLGLSAINEQKPNKIAPSDRSTPHSQLQPQPSRRSSVDMSVLPPNHRAAMFVLETIFLLPSILVIFVILGMLIFRRFRSIRALGWAMVVALPTAIALPLAAGVWIPDFLGRNNVLATAKTESGYLVEVVQRWNYVDFYTTEIVATTRAGETTKVILDGDDHKRWRYSFGLDERQGSLTVRLEGGRTIQIE